MYAAKLQTSSFKQNLSDDFILGVQESSGEFGRFLLDKLRLHTDLKTKLL